jgi:WD40 repeat protein
MKPILASRWTQLIAALGFLLALAAAYTWVVSQLPPRPRLSLQLDGDSLVDYLFSPDGKLLLALHARKDFGLKVGKIVLWDLSTGERRWSKAVDKVDYVLPDQSHPPPPGSESRAVEFSPDGKLLVIKSKGHRLQFWDAADGTLRLEKVLEHDEHVSSPSIDEHVWTRLSPDGRYLLFDKRPRTDNPQIIFWDLATDREWARIDAAYSSLHFAADGKRFTVFQAHPVLRNRSTVALWEMPGDGSPPRLLKQQVVIEGDFPDPFFSVVVSDDLQTYATVVRAPDSPGAYEIRLWDIWTGEKKARIDYRNTDGSPFHSLEFTRNGRFLMALFDKGEHVTWDLHGQIRAVRSLDFPPVVAPSGRWMLCRDETGADVWEIGSQRKHLDLRRETDLELRSTIIMFSSTLKTSLFPELPVSPPSLPGAYQFTSDGRFVMVTGFGTTTTPNLTEMVLSGQWNRINKRETVSIGRLWDVERGEEVAAFPGCDGALFSPDGRTLATLEDGHRICFWDVPPRFPYGLVLALTTATWGLVLVVCWLAKRLVRRLRH